jgi:F-type H+-transporting ATPase subunit alpha
MKKVAGGLRLDLASFRELEAFAQLGTELDPATQAKLDRGYRMVELLKQQQYQPMSVSEQIISLYAATRGHLDDISVDRVRDFEVGLLNHVKDRAPDLLEKIAEVGDLTTEIEDAIKAVISAFKAGFKK